MKKEIFIDELMNFITKATCSFTCIEEIKRILDENGFKELYESKIWKINDGKYYVVRNNASIVAFTIPKKYNASFSIVTTHSDTPSLLLKPGGAYTKENYLKYNVMPYGGLLNFGWLDHPLSLSGRIIINKNDTLQVKIVDLKEPIMIIPSVAIHQMTDANNNLSLNMQKDLQPILYLSKNIKDWDKILKKIAKDNIVDYDLFAYNPETPTTIGNNEILIAPRIDNLTSVYSSLESFLNSNDNNIKILCSFNNEEIGSLTLEGADSNFLLDILKRIAANINVDITKCLANSFIISSDNTHAIHPNHTEFSDDTGVCHLNDGFAIVKEETSTTNAISAAIIKEICNKNNIKYQISTAKNDISGGSTLSGISLRHVSVLSIDVGIPQLSMHSSIESASTNDIYELYKMMKLFYETKISKKKGTIKIN